MGDPGDEDDATPDRLLSRHLATHPPHLFRGVRILYPARRLPPLPDHDPGDEEPRLVLRGYDA